MAPAASSFLRISSASSLDTASLTGFGAPSTNSLASFKPSPVIARTSLMTAILLPPNSTKTTSNSVLASAPESPAASPPGAAATATAAGAAALTPHFSSSSFTRLATSITYCALSQSITCSFVISDILVYLLT